MTVHLFGGVWSPNCANFALHRTVSISPRGYTGPYVLRAQMLFQQLSRLNYGWDDVIPPDIAEQWGRRLKDIQLMRNLNIPRSVKPTDFNIKSNQLHNFADASETGYGAVTYLRMTDVNDKIHCSILMSKSRLAPLKGMTIPRLELTAAVEAIKMDELLRRELEIPLLESVYWSDSMIVLLYIQNDESRFQTYVANRIAKIRNHSSPYQWRHIPSKSNPADDASRGITAKLTGNQRWIHGPSFLWKDENAWPVQPQFKCAQIFSGTKC
ncbi:uncharacterized protein LOC117107594 [Anneissia japonica]|uniref:uncharacterized protein LOC117107594 n=1 Tax=Anneissia japonica TaxID=1529436 RepID=UPI001425A475|nr:uncharacterized protein LOC117107594 [Anneissia japonica]